MKIIRHKTPTEECFLYWINNYSESFHPLDEQRFYQFAHCVFSYNTRSWLNKEYFRKRILELKPYFHMNNIDVFYNRLLILKEYNESRKLDCITTVDGNGFIQRQVINNAIREVIITEDEYYHNGISKKEFINRLSDYDKQN